MANPNKPTIPSLLASLKGGKTKNSSFKNWKNFERPDFSNDKQRASRLEATLATGTDYTNADLKVGDLAAPHRVPYAKIRDYILNKENGAIKKAIGILLKPSKLYADAFDEAAKHANKKDASQYSELAELYRNTEKKVKASLKQLKNAQSLKEKAIAKLQLIVDVNNLASNAPGLGPHSDVNATIGSNYHLNLHPEGDRQYDPDDDNPQQITPRSRYGSEAFRGFNISTGTVKENVNDNDSKAKLWSVSGTRHTLKNKISPAKKLKYKSKNSLKVFTSKSNKIFHGSLSMGNKGRLFRAAKPFEEHSKMKKLS